MDIENIFYLIKISSVSVVKMIMWGVLCGFLALVFSLTLMLIFRKKIMVKRAHLVLKIMAIAWFVIVPLVSGYYMFKWAMLDSAEGAVCRNTEKFTKEINAAFNTELETVFSDWLGEGELEKKMDLSPDAMIDQLTEKIYLHYCTILEKESEKDGILSSVTGFILSFKMSDGISFAIKKTVRKILAKTLRLDNNYTKAMMGKKLREVFNANIFTEIVLTQVRYFFGNFKKSILIMLGIILLLPALEIGIAHYLEYRKKEKDPSF